MTIREIHGVANCTKRSAGATEGHEVTVTDGHSQVVLSIGDQTYPAGMTPDQAVMVAHQLIASAKRIIGEVDDG